MAAQEDDVEPEEGAGADPEETEEATAKPRRGPVATFLRETAIVVVAALVISIVVKTFFAQAFYIPSESMETTLLVGDKLVVNKLKPGPIDLERGDVVVFVDPGGWLPPSSRDPGLGEEILTWVGLLPANSGEHLIKRIIGLPGDHVQCCDDEGRLSVNGEPIDEPYIIDGAAPSDTDFDVVVPEDHLWVMGDNRSNSQDSRYNEGSVGGGFVPVRNVVGTTFVVIWPLDRAQLVHRPADTFENVPDPQ